MTDSEATSGPIRTHIQLRWGDQDALRHVNNVQISRLIEEARVRVFREIAGGSAAHVGPVLVARQELEYVMPLQYSTEPIVIETAISRIGSSSFDMVYTVFDAQGNVVTLGEGTMVTFDLRANTPVPLSDEVRAMLARHQGDPAPFRHRQR